MPGYAERGGGGRVSGQLVGDEVVEQPVEGIVG